MPVDPRRDHLPDDDASADRTRRHGRASSFVDQSTVRGRLEGTPAMLFDPPKPIETRVFATYPKTWHNADDSNDWVKTQPPGAHHTSLLEGPVFDPEGSL